MLTTSLEMMKKAYRGKYAIPAINTQGGTYDIICAACMAAEELKSPVILAHYVNTGEYSGHDWFYETAKWMAEKVSVPVAIHLERKKRSCKNKFWNLDTLPVCGISEKGSGKRKRRGPCMEAVLLCRKVFAG